MKYLLLLSLFLFGATAYSIELKTGDILLQPLNCRLCDLIEAEEQTIYSHIGLVVMVDNTPYVLEAFFGSVKMVTYAEFNKKTQRLQKLRVLRFADEPRARFLAAKTAEIVKVFKAKYEGLYYDSDFRWDNYDDKGREKLYCSELMVKLLNDFIVWDYPIKRMHFSRRPDDWDKHFKNNTPRDEWGNSPGDFERSAEFNHLGDI